VCSSDLPTILFTGLERQGLGELNGNATEEAVYALDATDVARAGEIGHIERTIGAIAGNTESSGYVLAGGRATVVGIAGERRPPA
jgi:hypothetical protein